MTAAVSTSSSSTTAKTIRFLFDVQCPYAYIASRRVESLANACQCNVEFFPVLLGGLYADTNAPQGKDGSATDVMAPNKRALNSKDLLREAARWNVPLKYNSKHPIRSVLAMRALVNTNDLDQRARFAHALYTKYWVDDADISDPKVITECAAQSGALVSAPTQSGQDKLRENTTWASSRGVFGVPTFFIMNGNAESTRFWHGQDRMFFLARALGLPPAHPLSNPLRLYPDRPLTNGAAIAVTIDFYHDFASPWSYLGSTQIYKLAAQASAKVRLKPILLGALFREIGTPNVPMLAISEAKRAYFGLDLQDFSTLLNVPVIFPKDFPLRTILPLRVQIIEPRCFSALYKAAWVDGWNIGDAEILTRVLSENGFDGVGLVRRANTDKAVKDALTQNTNDALQLGLCGVPSYVVQGVSDPVWGQDRSHVVLDQVAGQYLLNKL